jgi:hypothetical protein
VNQVEQAPALTDAHMNEVHDEANSVQLSGAVNSGVRNAPLITRQTLAASPDVYQNSVSPNLLKRY